MYTKLLKYLERKPWEYARSTSKFWDDEHISKYMLEAHLNPDLEAASRQHSFINASASWISNQVENPSKCKLLDLGCGPGIYAQAFSALGFCVTGIDFSKRSIDYAMSQAILQNMQINYHYENYLEMQYENEFDLITLIFCDYGVLPPGDRALLLNKIKTALKPNGLFILDGFTEKQYENFTESKTVTYEDKGFWSDMPYMCIQNNYRYDESKTYLEQYLIVTEDQLNCYNIWNQAFGATSFVAELKAAGFSEFQFYANVCGEALSDEDKTICVVAK
jgi:SAM-dependent methyltransferase